MESVPREPGLRERKKARAMRQIQEVALALFLERGFDQVTVEQVAAAAEVSPSTVYRYFGTKEGLMFHDEFDDTAIGAVVAMLETDVPLADLVLGAFTLVSDEHFVESRERTLQRGRLLLETPALRAAAAVEIAELTGTLAGHLAAARSYRPAAAYATVAALVGAALSAAYAWYEAQGEGDFLDHLREALTAIGELAGPVH